MKTQIRTLPAFIFFLLFVATSRADSRSYLSSIQAAALFKFQGNVSVQENASYPIDATLISNLSISPQDDSFDGIQIQIAHSGVLLSRFARLATTWQPDPGIKESNPFVPIILPNGDEGYLVSGEREAAIVFSSKRDKFDAYIDVVISEYTRDPVRETNGNRELINGLLNQPDRGLKFLTRVAMEVYPLLEQKYRTEAELRSQNALPGSPAAVAKLPSPAGSDSLIRANTPPSRLAPSQSIFGIFASAILLLLVIVGILVWKRRF